MEDKKIVRKKGKKAQGKEMHRKTKREKVVGGNKESEG